MKTSLLLSTVVITNQAESPCGCDYSPLIEAGAGFIVMLALGVFFGIIVYTICKFDD